ncbi:hypothetical protein HDU93_004419, partial [Gonapodya sp. JEL0774]
MADIESLKKQLEEANKKVAALEVENRKLSQQAAGKTSPVAIAAEGGTSQSGSLKFKVPAKPASTTAPTPVTSEPVVPSGALPGSALNRRGSVMTVVARYHGPEGDAEDEEDIERVVVVIPSHTVTVKGMDPYAHGALDLAVKSLVRDGDKLTVLVICEPETVVDGIMKLTTTSTEPARTERQSANYVKAVATKIYDWYPKDFTFEVRSINAKNDPVGAILSACESLKPTLMVVPRHPDKLNLWA